MERTVKMGVIAAVLSVFQKNRLFFALILIAGVLFTYKLDNEYFFTDEILYVNSGREYLLKQDFTLNLQHPLLSKYLAGIASLPDRRNVFLMRLPFALLGVACSLIVFRINENEFNDKLLAFCGGLLYLSFPYIFTSTRMVMMESPLYLFWLSTAYLVLKKNFKSWVPLGLAIGLGFATKATFVTILPAVLLVLFTAFKTTPLKEMLKGLITAIFAFGLTYLPMVLFSGFDSLINVLRAIKDILLERNKEGKIHIIGDQVFNKSPWWFYIYYVSKEYLFSNFIVLALIIFIKRNKFALFWLSFFICNFILFQVMGLKNARYIGAMEIPLVFLAVSTLARIKYKFIILGLSSTALLANMLYLYNLQPTSYHGLYKFVSAQTNKFSNGDRTYIYGSIRSSRWQFEQVQENIIVSRKDFDVIGLELPNFKFIVIDKTEELKNPDNYASQFVKEHRPNYDLVILDNLQVNIRKQ